MFYVHGINRNKGYISTIFLKITSNIKSNVFHANPCHIFIKELRFSCVAAVYKLKNVPNFFNNTLNMFSNFKLIRSDKGFEVIFKKGAFWHFVSEGGPPTLYFGFICITFCNTLYGTFQTQHPTFPPGCESTFEKLQYPPPEKMPKIWINSLSLSD